MANNAYGQPGQPNPAQAATIRNHIAQSMGRQQVAPQSAPNPQQLAPQQLPAQANVQPQQPPMQSVPAQQVPQYQQPAQSVYNQSWQPQTQPQPDPRQPWQQVDNRVLDARFAPQQQQAGTLPMAEQANLPAQPHPALAQAAQDLGLAQSVAQTQQNELVELKAKVKALESVGANKAAQDRIQRRIESDSFLSNPDNFDPDQRSARIAQIQFEEMISARELGSQSNVRQPENATQIQPLAPELQQLILERQIIGQLGYSLSPTQTQVIARVASEIGGDIKRAASLAQQEHPEIFGIQPSFQPGPSGHEMLTPSGAVSPNRLEPSDRDTYGERRNTALGEGRLATDSFVRGELTNRILKHFPEIPQG